MLRASRKQQKTAKRQAGTAPLRRPGAVRLDSTVTQASQQRTTSLSRLGGQHPLCRPDDNARLLSYETEVKEAFDKIVPTLKDIAALQYDADFETHAQQIAVDRLGFELPDQLLADAWVQQLDMRRLFAYCTFKTYSQFCTDFFAGTPTGAGEELQQFMQDCGFHCIDITPCADGRLAHMIRYVLRLSPRAVRRKSYAGAMFDIEDSIQKWTEVELHRYREGIPNTADANSRYLKIVAYHFSSVDPDHEGCAAHGSDTAKAAAGGLERLTSFRQAIENSYCCGASIDLLLIGLDTDTDAIRVHIPDSQGEMSLDQYIETNDLYDKTVTMTVSEASLTIEREIRACSADVSNGMARFIGRLVENNMSQIEYVRQQHQGTYPDIGHAERFIGAGVGFEEIQLRNLMYFAYLNTVEEGTADLDVGIKIFSGLNVAHGLPIPVVVRFDYHGHIPGARERARERCQRVASALINRFNDLYQQGLLHILQVARDCDGTGPLERFNCSALPEAGSGH